MGIQGDGGLCTSPDYVLYMCQTPQQTLEMTRPHYGREISRQHSMTTQGLGGEGGEKGGCGGGQPAEETEGRQQGRHGGGGRRQATGE